MKVKRFNNLWAMGLILCGVLLVAFYIAKIFFPKFIVGVAEIPSIVEFGNLIDGNVIYRNLFDLFTTLIIASIYACACCRLGKLNLKSFGIVFIYSTTLRLSSNFFADLYTVLNIVGLLICPLLISILNKNVSKETFISTVVCFSSDCLIQVLSLKIRDITLIANTLNTATFFILLIDVVIWRVLFYCYFNYKNKGGKDNG